MLLTCSRRLGALAVGAVALAMAVAVPAGPAGAEPKPCLKTVTVTDAGDSGAAGQLRSAIGEVCNGGSVVVDASVTGPIQLTGAIVVDKNVKVIGAGQTVASSDLGVFHVLPAGTLKLSGFTLSAPRAYSGVDVEGVLVLKDVTVTGSAVSGIWARPGSSVRLTRGTVITGNSSGREREGGAGIYNNGGSVTLTDDAAVTNNLTWACFAVRIPFPPYYYLSGYGAGIFSKGGGTVTLQDHAAVSDNAVMHCDQTRDDPWGLGGGIFSAGGAITLGGSAQVTGNAAGNGGGIAVAAPPAGEADTAVTVTLNDLASVSGNYAGGDGGGIRLMGGTATDQLVMNNAATISGNTSDNGGGVANSNSVVTLNGTASITGNTAGGVYNTWTSWALPPPRLLVNDGATISGNSPYDVYPANSAAPVAVDDRYSLDTTGGATTLTVTAAQGVLANDTDPDMSQLAALLVTGPTHGTLTGGALAWNGSFAYTPEPGFSGVDTFTYKALDQSFASNTATVQIIVNVFCNGQLATIVGSGTITGTSGDDVIVGSAGPDTINGLGGNDTICALAGDDTVTGGPGTDVIDAGDGTDTLVESGATFTLTDTSLTRVDVGAGTSTDTLAGIEQATLTGSTVNDTLNASAFSGPVTLDGLAGSDTLTGGSGDDMLTGGPGLDVINGGSGLDTIVESREANMTLTNTRLTIGGEGTDTLSSIERAILTGGPSANTLNASAFTGQVTLSGGGGNDTITGAAGDDFLYGGDGDDWLYGGPGDDTIYGGPGTDTCISSAGIDLVYECEL